MLPASGNTKPMKNKTYSYKINTILFLFFAASFAGFLWEVLIFLIKDGEFCNRGFFYGPWLPVYGAGAVLIFVLLYPKRKHPLLCFFYSACIGAVVELFTGWLLDTLFGKRYWDYTGQFLSIRGYICLYSVLGFALAGAFFTCLAAPFLLKYWERLSLRTRHRILAVLLLLFVVDAAAALIFPNSGSGVTCFYYSSPKSPFSKKSPR